MATTKVNKDKLKRMMGQKDALSINLGKRRKQDSASKQVSEEVEVRPSMPQKPVLPEQAPVSLVEVVEPASVPSSSKATDKPPTLPKDATLALRRAKTVVMKEDMDEYGRLNTDVVKRALAHSMMKVGAILPFCLSSLFSTYLVICSFLQGLTEAMIITNHCIQWEEGIVKLKDQLTEAMNANKSPTTVATELTQERDHLADELARLRVHMAAKDEELNKMVESNRKVLDQLKTLSE